MSFLGFDSLSGIGLKRNPKTRFPLETKPICHDVSLQDMPAPAVLGWAPACSASTHDVSGNDRNCARAALFLSGLVLEGHANPALAFTIGHVGLAESSRFDRKERFSSKLQSCSPWNPTGACCFDSNQPKISANKPATDLLSYPKASTRIPFIMLGAP